MRLRHGDGRRHARHDDRPWPRGHARNVARLSSPTCHSAAIKSKEQAHWATPSASCRVNGMRRRQAEGRREMAETIAFLTFPRPSLPAGLMPQLTSTRPAASAHWGIPSRRRREDPSRCCGGCRCRRSRRRYRGNVSSAGARDHRLAGDPQLSALYALPVTARRFRTTRLKLFSQRTTIAKLG